MNKPLMDFVAEALEMSMPLPWEEKDLQYGYQDYNLANRFVELLLARDFETARLLAQKQKAREVYRTERNERDRREYAARMEQAKQEEMDRKLGKVERNTEHPWLGQKTQCFVKKSTDQSYYGSNCSKSAQFVVPLGNRRLTIPTALGVGGDDLIQDFALACTKHATNEAKYGAGDVFWPLYRGFDSSYRIQFFADNRRDLQHLIILKAEAE